MWKKQIAMRGSGDEIHLEGDGRNAEVWGGNYKMWPWKPKFILE